MLRSATPVVREVLKSHPKGGADVATIAQIVQGVTSIDRIHYVGYDVPATNPFVGGFKRFKQQDAPYANVVDVVEVRYAKHLPPPARRFVVCKELCHALEAPDGSHSVSEQGLDDLVASFSLISSNKEPDYELQSVGIEMLALVTAIEIICPLPRRVRLLEKFGDNLDFALVTQNYGLQFGASRSCFQARYISMMTTIYRNYGLL